MRQARRSTRSPKLAREFRSGALVEKPAILIDGASVMNQRGTGIASYARTLAVTLRDTNCVVGVLYGSRVKSAKDSPPIALANQVFGKSPPEHFWSRTLRLTSQAITYSIRRSRRIPAIVIPTDQVDLSAVDEPLLACDQVLNANGIYEQAQQFFAMKGRLIEVDVPRSYQAAHWTGPMAVKARGIPNIYTIHDLIPLQFPYMVIDKDGRAAKLHDAISREADLIITVSETSKRHIVSLLGVPEDRVSVTYQPVPALPPIAREDAEHLVQSVYGATPGEYALYLGAIEPKKNLKRLIEAYLYANLDMPLLLAGPNGWLYEDVLELIDTVGRQATGTGPLPGCLSSPSWQRRKRPWPRWQRHKSTPRRSEYPAWHSPPPVQRLGYLPRSHIVALLQCARFFVFPSIYEGFGLPILEAMQLGTPVLTSNTGSMLEVAGDAAVLVDPLNLSDIAQGVRKLANDDGLREELTRRGRIQAVKFNIAAYRRRLREAYRLVGVEIEGTRAGASCSPLPAHSAT